MTVFTGQQFTQQSGVASPDVAVIPDGFDLMVTVPRIILVERSDPLIKRLLHRIGILLTQFPLGPVAIAILRPLLNFK